MIGHGATSPFPVLDQHIIAINRYTSKNLTSDQSACSFGLTKCALDGGRIMHPFDSGSYQWINLQCPDTSFIMYVKLALWKGSFCSNIASFI